MRRPGTLPGLPLGRGRREQLEVLESRETSPRGRARFGIGVALAAAALAAPTLAQAHVERSTYWPDPAPDTSVNPAAGGEVPEARTLKSALNKSLPGDTHVVCQPNSMKLAKQAIRHAKKEGIELRPSEDPEKISRKKARRLKRQNKKFKKKCGFDSIQDAVLEAGNNDRIVVMPGIYTEPESRAKPENDPACAHLTADSDHGTGAVGYQYQATCPNDQNLIAVIGREPTGAPEPPVDPDTDRSGIPPELLGPCIRCNLQIEGSVPDPDAVVVDAGEVASGNGGPANPVKDVVLRLDRADGAVVRNMTFRHAAEHGIYPIEVDGYLLDRVKMFHNEEYGHLSFTSDHGLLTNCEAAGSGDAGVYPGAAAQTGEQTEEPTQRYNQQISNCDLHHNVLGHSGSMGDAIHIVKNDVYDNAVGISVDSISAAGHPGYPQDSLLVEDNEIYSNNFNPFEPNSDVVPTVPAAVGTGMWIAGGNANVLQSNHIYDNWRRGVMLFSVPDAIACAPGDAQQTCDETGIPENSNSHRNVFRNNVMGRSPTGEALPNGLDFWWDESVGTRENCWVGNTGTDGSPGSVSGDPQNLPADCASSLGTGSPDKFSELLTCFAATEGGPQEACPWFTTPPKP
jgi:Right handed beta helix region